MKKNYRKLICRICELKNAFPNFQVHIPGHLTYSGKEYPFFALSISRNKRPFQGDKKNICITAGIHGDEPAGVEALLAIIESGDFLERHLESFDFMIFPCVNPAGYEDHKRENPDGVDLNRQFNHTVPPPEVTYIKEMTREVPFSLHIDFHEDIDAPGFYLYEVVQDGALPFGEKIIDAVSGKYPINLQGTIEGRKAINGIIRSEEQNLSSGFQEILESDSNWPMVFYFYSKGTSHAFTFETPVHLNMKERIEIHKMAFSSALASLDQSGVFSRTDHANPMRRDIHFALEINSSHQA
jgi:protein MpaA